MLLCRSGKKSRRPRWSRSCGPWSGGGAKDPMMKTGVKVGDIDIEAHTVCLDSQRALMVVKLELVARAAGTPCLMHSLVHGLSEN